MTETNQTVHYEELKLTCWECERRLHSGSSMIDNGFREDYYCLNDFCSRNLKTQFSRVWDGKAGEWRTGIY